jgi:LPXTG-site transpeptidase (sortase) family protein
MNKYIRRTIFALFAIVVVVIVVISTFFIVRYCENKGQITKVEEVYSSSIIQDNSTNEEKTIDTKVQDNLLKVDGKTTLGIITIEKIKYKGLIYEGTDEDTLSKGVGHFENSPYLNGNVCFAAHNYISVWAKLHTLIPGDIVNYTSFLGTKTYQVSTIQVIDETDWSMLKDTDDNRITLITCVYKQPNKRLCVQALEKK